MARAPCNAQPPRDFLVVATVVAAPRVEPGAWGVMTPLSSITAVHLKRQEKRQQARGKRQQAHGWRVWRAAAWWWCGGACLLESGFGGARHRVICPCRTSPWGITVTDPDGSIRACSRTPGKRSPLVSCRSFGTGRTDLFEIALVVAAEHHIAQRELGRRVVPASSPSST